MTQKKQRGFSWIALVCRAYDENPEHCPLKLHPDQHELVEAIAGQGIPFSCTIHRLNAPPGCGKTHVFATLACVFAQIMSPAASEQIEQALPRTSALLKKHLRAEVGEKQPIMWVTAPTKSLVSEIAEMFSKAPLAIQERIIPLGNTPDGEQRYWQHVDKLVHIKFRRELDRIKALEQEATRAYDKVCQNPSSINRRYAHRCFRQHYVAASTFWESADVVNYMEELPKKAIVFISTGGFKLKTDAKATRAVAASLFTDKLPILLVQDKSYFTLAYKHRAASR